ncbi:hypothetical protein Pst134EA_004914 [Puccinia striiformis f. sp. tritici]|uniref:hypothetical protein n=1 Tax=Puccinia striiformis f. sp. tritici TaxID=168172 RepID=UPI00200813CD|nr:hypothetical protein Pst134EA_004914 [Puccinia striiformis f. sp. tritici]KAH9471004.1 hypothetical protein Pst134EA_004914 [Puccinia striiformis f. sp. tritici]
MVTSVFLENQIIQKSMGYNFDASHPTRVEDFPIKTVVSLRKEDQTTLPNKLADLDTKPNNISQIAQIQINKHDQVHKGVFVAVGHNCVGELAVGMIDLVWEVTEEGQKSYVCKVIAFKQKGVDDFYEMQQLVRTRHSEVISARLLQGCINVQHNCHLGKCAVHVSKVTLMKRQETTVKTWQVEHTNIDHYIINTASLHDPQLHRKVSNLTLPTVSPSQWKECISKGFSVWSKTTDNKEDEEDEDDELEFEHEQVQEEADMAPLDEESPNGNDIMQA